MKLKQLIKRMTFTKHLKHLIVLLTLGVITSSVALFAQIPQKALKFGAVFLSDTEYAKLPRVNWDMLTSRSNVRTIALKSTTGITMLQAPPVGNQGSEGSCVGWAVGYAAASILTYPKYNAWSMATRSPSYVFNQIKKGTDCSVGSFTIDAVNLIKNQGVCSWSLMPYVDGDCYTLPSSIQRSDAAMHNILDWQTLEKNDVDGIKRALNLGFPIVIGIDVYQPFIDMWYNGGIWNTPNTGSKIAGHAVCIVGYDDIKQMFKVQNSWGTWDGDAGYFWVTYNLIRNNCLREAYVLSGINPTYPYSISGPDALCAGSPATYSISNLPQEATVTWYASGLTPSTATGTTFTASVIPRAGNGSVTATITTSQKVFTLTKEVALNGYTPIDGPDSEYLSNKKAYFSIETDGSSVKQWAVNGDVITNSINPNRIVVPLYKYYPGSILVTCTVSSACGTFEAQKGCEIVGDNTPPREYSIYPNPTSTIFSIKQNTNIELMANSPADDKAPTDNLSIMIYNNQSQLVHKQKVYSGQQVSVSNLRNGLYIIHINDGKKTYKEKLIIKRN